MRADNARFWEALRELLIEAGLRDLPERLTFDRLPVPERIGPQVFLSQTCGYPLETIFSGHGRFVMREGCRVVAALDDNQQGQRSSVVAARPAVRED